MQDINKKYTSIKTKTKKINVCRIYLGVTFLSEISKVEGSSLNMTLLNNNTNNRVNSRSWWPRQQKRVKVLDKLGLLFPANIFCSQLVSAPNNNIILVNRWLLTKSETVTPTSTSIHSYNRYIMLTRRPNNIVELLEREHIPSFQTLYTVSKLFLQTSSQLFSKMTALPAQYKDITLPELHQ